MDFTYISKGTVCFKKIITKNPNQNKKNPSSLELLGNQGQLQPETELIGREAGSELCMVWREMTQNNQVKHPFAV